MVDMPIKLNLETAAKRPLPKREKLDQFKDCAEGQVPAKRAHPVARLISAALVVAFIAAAGACTSDGQTGHPTDTNTDSDAPTDTITDSDGESGPCTGPGEPLEGGVSDIPNSVSGNVSFAGPEGSVEGTMTLTVGAEIGSADFDVVPLGECGGGIWAAAGAQGDSIPVVPQARADFTPDPDEGSLSGPGTEDACERETGTIPISIDEAYSNWAVWGLKVNGSEAPVELAFTDSLSPILLVDGVPSAESTVLLDGTGSSPKSISIALPPGIQKLAASVSSSAGAEILAAMLESDITAALAGGEMRSGTMKIAQMGAGESMVPVMEWDDSIQKICSRCTPGEATQSVEAAISVPIDPDCGAMHGGFAIEGFNVEIDRVTPTALEDDYEITGFTATGLDPLENGVPTITITIQRTPHGGDLGERVDIYFVISGQAVSLKKNPKTGDYDVEVISLEKVFRDPDVWTEYWLECPGDCIVTGVS